MVEASSLNHLLQKHATTAAAAAASRQLARCSPVHSEQSCQPTLHKCTSDHLAATTTAVRAATAAQSAPRPPTTTPPHQPASASAANATDEVSLLLSPSEEVAAHRATYARFFTMLRVGVPRETVEQAMRLAGVDPVELDGPHLAFETTAAAASSDTGATAAANAFGSDSQLHTAAAVVRKNVLRKRLFWDAKTEALLERLFVKDALAPSPRSTGGTVFARKACIAILETKKAQNIGITLARVKLSLPDLVHELVSLNPTVLCAAQLRSLLDMWPDRKELEAIDAFSGDTALLGKAEQFFVEIKRIPRFRETLACLIFRQEFASRAHELREAINLVIRGIHQLCSSRALQHVFRFLLDLGNTLNFGADSPHAARVVGFSLSSLGKLAQTKAFTGGITLLQFAVHAMSRDCPHLLTFPKDVHLVTPCSKVSLQSLVAERKALEVGWQATALQADAVKSQEESASTDIASSILTHFATEVESDLDAIDALLQQLYASKQRFVAYFDEQDAPDELDALLQHIAHFVDAFAHEQRRLAETSLALERAIAVDCDGHKRS